MWYTVFYGTLTAALLSSIHRVRTFRRRMRLTAAGGLRGSGPPPHHQSTRAITATLRATSPPSRGRVLGTTGRFLVASTTGARLRADLEAGVLCVIATERSRYLLRPILSNPFRRASISRDSFPGHTTIQPVCCTVTFSVRRGSTRS